MRESWWRSAFAYFYFVIMMWGLFVWKTTPVTIAAPLGSTYTIIWTWSAMFGGFLALVSVLVGLRHGKLYQTANRIEMIACIGIVLAVAFYDLTLWFIYMNGMDERLGLAWVFHVVALPAAGRVIWLGVVLFKSIVRDSTIRGFKKRGVHGA